MVAMMLLAIVVHPGGAPSDWQLVRGLTNLEYRWSLPYSNTCRVEFESKGVVAAQQAPAQQFELITRVLSARPSSQIDQNPDNPMHIEATKMRAQTSDRVIHIHLPGIGRTSETLHNCYGVQTVEAPNGKNGTTSEPLSDINPK